MSQIVLPPVPPVVPPIFEVSPIFESTESHKKPIYSVSWSGDVSTAVIGGRTVTYRYFATCAQKISHVYKVTEIEGTGKNISKSSTKNAGKKDTSKSTYEIDLVQAYKDPTQEEDFYCVAWGGRTGGFPFEPNVPWKEGDPRPTEMLALAGKGRKINLVNPTTSTLISTLMGHGDEINEIMFVPIGSTDFGKASEGLGGFASDEYLLISASKDESIRLWNTRCGTCVIAFAGDRGHRDDVLSIDLHPLGHTLVSSGIDTTIKLWSFEDSNSVRDGVKKSEEQLGLGLPPRGNMEVDGTCSSEKRLFFTYNVQLPYYSTNKVHYDYVDCVRFAGDCVLSKSISNVIVMWKPVVGKGGRSGIASANDSDGVVPLREFVLDECNLWFIRFNLDDQARFLAIGNNLGEVRVWDMIGDVLMMQSGEGGKRGKVETTEYLLRHEGARTCVRNLKFNGNGDLIVTVSDGGRVFVYQFDGGDAIDM